MACSHDAEIETGIADQVFFGSAQMSYSQDQCVRCMVKGSRQCVEISALCFVSPIMLLIFQVKIHVAKYKISH